MLQQRSARKLCKSTLWLSGVPQKHMQVPWGALYSGGIAICMPACLYWWHGLHGAGSPAGDRYLMPPCFRLSTRPATNGASGPTSTSPISRSLHHLTTCNLHINVLSFRRTHCPLWHASFRHSMQLPRTQSPHCLEVHRQRWAHLRISTYVQVCIRDDCRLRGWLTSALDSMSRSATEVTLGSALMPGLPGAQNSVSSMCDCDSFHASACSLPPPPTSKTST